MKLLRNLVAIEPLMELQPVDILLPDYAENVLPCRGKVIAVGPKAKDVKVGQTVIFDRFRVDNLKDKQGKNKLLYISEDLILATYE